MFPKFFPPHFSTPAMLVSGRGKHPRVSWGVRPPYWRFVVSFHRSCWPWCPHCHPCLRPLITPLAQPGPASFPDLPVACLRGDEFLGTVPSTTTWTSQGQPSSSTSMMMYPFLEACGPPGAPEREQGQVPSRCPLFNWGLSFPFPTFGVLPGEGVPVWDSFHKTLSQPPLLFFSSLPLSLVVSPPVEFENGFYS